ncbi:MAG: WD40/YVTN/BNR-like repeat-containing protein, partial [Gemmatimonadales bacterium]
MRISAPASAPAPPARRNGLSNLAMRVIVTTLALVIVPVTAVSQQDNPRRRWEYFYQQRAYPFDRIPAGALQAARRQEVARWPAQFAPGASFASHWTQIGPAQIIQLTNQNSSGRLTAIAVHPTNSSIIYIGGAQGGVWKTTNGGTSWSPLTDTQCSLAMGGLAIDPVDPNIIYAGTGEQHFSGDSYYGCG